MVLTIEYENLKTSLLHSGYNHFLMQGKMQEFRRHRQATIPLDKWTSDQPYNIIQNAQCCITNSKIFPFHGIFEIRMR